MTAAVTGFYLTTASLGWADGFTHFLLPALMGNIVGGVLLVAVLNHAQVTAGSG